MEIAHLGASLEHHVKQDILQTSKIHKIKIQFMYRKPLKDTSRAKVDTSVD